MTPPPLAGGAGVHGRAGHRAPWVLDGHVDTKGAGPGALYRLDTLTPDSRLSVKNSTGSVEYRMVARAVYDEAGLPAELFATYGQPRLAVVTCGGPFNSSTGHYRDNIVVYGLPLVALP